jgi:hypothetical protein
MALAEIEQARVRKAMDAFMQQGRPPPQIRPKLDLGVRVTGQSVEIFEIRPHWPARTSRRETGVARSEGNLRTNARYLARVLAATRPEVA